MRVITVLFPPGNRTITLTVYEHVHTGVGGAADRFAAVEGLPPPRGVTSPL
jgi:hypothetical protein